MENKERIKHIGDLNFSKDVLQSKKPTLVDFWAPWCGPCRAIAPLLEELAGEYDGLIDIVKINIDDNPQTGSRYGVRSIPTLLFVKNGNVLETKIGLASKADLVAMINRNLK